MGAQVEGRMICNHYANYLTIKKSKRQTQTLDTIPNWRLCMDDILV